MKNKNIKLLLNYGLGPVLFVWLSWSIWQQVQNQPDLDGSFAKIKNSIGGDQSWKLFVCLFFVIVNWGLEARKWQILIRYIQPISFLKAFKATLAGLAFAMNTLNRIGEYGGRVVFVQHGLRWKAVSLTIIGSISQLIITLVFGIAGLFFVINHPSGDYDLWIKVLLSGTVFVTTGLIFLYFRFGFMIKLLARIPRTARFLQHVNVIENLPVRILLRVLLLSGIRYIVF
ncbi:MAG: flippase-like domain-containing protein, partial [Gemmatimonadaceae bacterium]|nr:flippase-like domain-containing protein [Chitinophagaceae bacterium]